MSRLCCLVCGFKTRWPPIYYCGRRQCPYSPAPSLTGATAPHQERANHTASPAEPLQGAHAPLITTLQKDTAHHAEPVVVTDQHAEANNSDGIGVGPGANGSLPSVATPPTTTTTGE
jgi:hypothetical protein